MPLSFSERISGERRLPLVVILRYLYESSSLWWWGNLGCSDEAWNRGVTPRTWHFPSVLAVGFNTSAWPRRAACCQRMSSQRVCLAMIDGAGAGVQRYLDETQTRGRAQQRQWCGLRESPGLLAPICRPCGWIGSSHFGLQKPRTRPRIAGSFQVGPPDAESQRRRVSPVFKCLANPHCLKRGLKRDLNILPLVWVDTAVGSDCVGFERTWRESFTPTV